MSRSQDDVVTRMRAIESSDFFGFRAETLAGYLDFDHAKEFATAEATPETWGAHLPLTDADAILAAARAYMAFAWGKARDHRGISANRSVEKLTEWTWLLGRDDVVEQVEATPYPMYGCPQLEVIAKAFDFPIPDDHTLARMRRGEPCQSDCMDGCS